MNTRPHRIPVALRPDQPEINEVISIAAAVMQQQWRVTIIADYHLHETIVVEIGKGDTPANVRGCEARPCLLRCLHKLAGTLVMEQRVDLLEVHFIRRLLHFGIYVAVGNEKIKPAIVVIIEETATKAKHIARRYGDACLIAHLFKRSFALVVPKMI